MEVPSYGNALDLAGPVRLVFCFRVQATKAELAATRAVVAEQTSTERALLVEAAQTAASLAAAEVDVEGLRAKVARQVTGAPSVS